MYMYVVKYFQLLKPKSRRLILRRFESKASRTDMIFYQILIFML